MMRVALLQLNSNADIAANIARVELLAGEAAAGGAQLIALPENAFRMTAPGAEREYFTQGEHPGVAASAALAKRHGVWLLAGSVSVRDSGLGIQDSGKAYNRSLLFDPLGNAVASYDKIHLFDVDVGDGQDYRESKKVIPGEWAVTVEVLGAACSVFGEDSVPPNTEHAAPNTSIGMTICYDLRFPQLYRALAKAGAEILAVPSAFTQVTGEAHWHVLLRARAIENGCFVIAPAQCGEHPGGRRTYGHSLIVDPWGTVLADGGTAEGVVMADLDLGLVKKTRARLPSLTHDRPFQA